MDSVGSGVPGDQQYPLSPDSQKTADSEKLLEQKKIKQKLTEEGNLKQSAEATAKKTAGEKASKAQRSSKAHEIMGRKSVEKSMRHREKSSLKRCRKSEEASPDPSFCLEKPNIPKPNMSHEMDLTEVFSRFSLSGMKNVAQKSSKSIQEVSPSPKNKPEVDPENARAESREGTIIEDAESNTAINLSYDTQWDFAIQQLSKKDQETQKLMKSNPEFNQFRSHKDTQLYHQLQSSAFQKVSNHFDISGVVLHQKTASSDTLRTAAYAEFSQFVDRSVRHGEITNRQASMMHRVFAGDDPHKFQELSVKGENIGELAKTTIEKMYNKAEHDHQSLAHATPPNIDQDLFRVKSAFEHMKHAESELVSELGEVNHRTMQKYEQFLLSDRKPTGLTHEEKKAFEKVYEKQNQSHPVSALSIKFMQRFSEGYKNHLNDAVSHHYIGPIERELLEEPIVAFEDNSKLNEHQKKLLDELIQSGGLREVKSWIHKFSGKMNTTRNHIMFIAQLQTSARANNVPLSELTRVLFEFKDGKINLDQLTHKLGKAGEFALKSTSREGGFIEGEKFQLDSSTLQEVLKSQEDPVMRLKFRSGRYILEKLNAAKSLLSESPKISGEIKDDLETQLGQENMEISIASYVMILGKFGSTILNMLTKAQISEINGLTDIEDLSLITSSQMKTESYNDWLESKKKAEEEEKSHSSKGGIGGFFEKAWDDVKLAFEIVAPILGMGMSIFLGAAAFAVETGLLALSMGAMKDIADEGWTQASQQGTLDTFNVGLETMGIPQDSNLELVCDALAIAFAATEAIVMAAISVLLAIPTGGLTLLSGALAAGAILGIACSTAASLVEMGSSFVGQLAQDHYISEDKAQGIETVLGDISTDLAIAGAVLTLPSLVESLGSIVSTAYSAGTSACDSITAVANATWDYLRQAPTEEFEEEAEAALNTDASTSDELEGDNLEGDNIKKDETASSPLDLSQEEDLENLGETDIDQLRRLSEHEDNLFAETSSQATEEKPVSITDSEGPRYSEDKPVQLSSPKDTETDYASRDQLDDQYQREAEDKMQTQKIIDYFDHVETIYDLKSKAEDFINLYKKALQLYDNVRGKLPTSSAQENDLTIQPIDQSSEGGELQSTNKQQEPHISYTGQREKMIMHFVNQVKAITPESAAPTTPLATPNFR